MRTYGLGIPESSEPEPRSTRATLVHNERTKLRATALNSIAITSIAAGFVTPLAAVAFGIPGAASRGFVSTVIAALAFFVIGVGLHLLAIRLLGVLEE